MPGARGAYLRIVGKHRVFPFSGIGYLHHRVHFTRLKRASHRAAIWPKNLQHSRLILSCEQIGERRYVDIWPVTHNTVLIVQQVQSGGLTLPSPKWATGSISQRYPEPPSMMRVWAPLWLVRTVTLAPRANEPYWVRGITRSQLLDEPCKGCQIGWLS